MVARKLMAFACALLFVVTSSIPLVGMGASVAELITRGERDAAKRELDAQEAGLDKLPQESASINILRTMATQYRELGARTSAIPVLQRGIKMAERLDPDSLPGLLSELGLTQSELEDHDHARKTFQAILDRLPASNTEERIEALTNLLNAEIRSGDDFAEVTKIVQAFQSEVKVLGALTCDIHLRFASALVSSGHLLAFAETATKMLRTSLRLATNDDDHRSVSYVWGLLAVIAEKQGQLDQALELNRQALMGVLNDHPEARYRWQWQIGRVQSQMGDNASAIVTYRQSLETLESIQSELLNGSYVVFRERVIPVYDELIELLLVEASKASGSRAQELLLGVQETIEAFNKSELLDYFNDDCVLPQETMQLSGIGADTAVIYPIVLADKVVIISKLPDGLYQAVSDVSVSDLLANVAEFRDAVSTVDFEIETVKEIGQILYQALISPIKPQISKFDIKRLVFVPDAKLRLIPMSALFDGNKYLVEQYEIGTTLGLTLTDRNSLLQDNVRVLAGGISDSVSGFDALPGVLSEVNAIHDQTDADVFMNGDFSVDLIADKLATGGHSIVHMATHGVFQGEASNSYLLTYSDKLTLDRLQDTVGSRRFSGTPLDLLVLSACETAKGNDRAALGLAGVALKAGARSTLASLWLISDESTSRLMKDFYKLLYEGNTKSEALRTAQLNLLTDPAFEHPNYWSPYLLIGNWM